MDTCVRNQLYDEALDMRAYVFMLAAKFSDVKLLKEIVLYNATHQLSIYLTLRSTHVPGEEY